MAKPPRFALMNQPIRRPARTLMGPEPSSFALASWLPDKTLAKTCADFSDLEIGPDGCLYLLSDKSYTIARLDDLPPGGGAAALLDAWRLGNPDGKPEGLAFTAQGRAVVGLDTRKPRRNLLLLEPAIAELRGGGQSLS
jgi:hypothetical protein